MYKALYRKWRPLTFDDVISQQHITDTLKNQIKSEKTAHAYLFTGSRGTGKTTCSRILAKAVNCPNMKDGNPCLECEVCRGAEEGSLTDIVEIDAASNNGVDDIRDLRDGAVYTPEVCTYRIYIIDEVHMLSTSAFNALLKIMEEPPPYVKFILATTEIHKVPATITSRCQRYDFRRIRQDDIAERLEYIAQQEQLQLTHEGAMLIAKLADGGMRDAVSLLDQCSVCAEVIDAAAVSNASGIAGRDHLYEILEAVNDSDTVKALETSGRLYDMSKDLTRLCEELIMQMRNIMLIKISPQSASGLIACMPDEYERLCAIAEKTELPVVMKRLDMFQECREKMKNVINKRVEFEMCLIRICGNIEAVQPQTVSAPSPEISERIRKLEETIMNLSSGQPVSPVRTEREVRTAVIPLEKTLPDDKNAEETECTRWDEIMKVFWTVRPSMASSMVDTRAVIQGNKFTIYAKNQLFINLMKGDAESREALKKTIFQTLGREYMVVGRCDTTPEEQQNMATALLKKAQNSNIETAVDNNIK